MTTWLKARPDLTLGKALGFLEGDVKKCDVHLSERGPVMTLRPPFTELSPFAALYLDRTCLGFSFGFDSGPGSPLTASVLLAPPPPAAPSAPID